MMAKKNICTKQQIAPKKQCINDLFSDLKPLDPFDVKKEELSAQLCSLLAFSEKSRTEFSYLSGWKKSRITKLLNGKSNPTFKTLWEFAGFLGYEADLNFRKQNEVHANQPWSSRTVESQYTICTDTKLVFKCQTAKEVAKDMREGNHQQYYFSVSMQNNSMKPIPIYRLDNYIPSTFKTINLEENIDIQESI